MSHRLIAAACLAGLIGADAWPGGGTIVNRRIGEVAIVPDGAGAFDVHVHWTIEAGGTSVGLDQSTVVALFVGSGSEVPVASAPVGVLLDVVFGGPCGISPPSCGGGCGGGYIDGVFNTLLCLPGAGCQSMGCDCACRFPWIQTTLGGVELEPGHTLVAALIPASGSFPEMNPGDDAVAFFFDGAPRLWDRRMVGVEAIPSGEPGHYDIAVAFDALFVGLDTPTAHFQEVLLFQGGVVVASASACDGNPWFIDPGNPCSGGAGCLADPCATGSCAGTATELRCEIAKCGPGSLLCCACVSDLQQLVFQDVAIAPGEKPLVILKPSSGGLPELPGFEDDEAEVVLPCAGDLDGNGVVDGADLGLLLAAWGTPGPGDLDRNGVVDGADLGLLLAAWGVCFPT